jgi:hypothetical protein
MSCEHGIPIRHGRGRNEAERFFVRYCFDDAAIADAYRDRFGGERLMHNRGRRAAPKRKRRYEPRNFDGRVIMSDEIERLDKEILEYERVEVISDPMRELIDDLWSELVHKLPPKKPQG